MLALVSARVSAALAKTSAARAFGNDEIAKDALKFAKTSLDARSALERQIDISKYETLAAKIIQNYGAELVSQRDLDGMVFGIRFLDGSQPRNASNVFFVA